MEISHLWVTGVLIGLMVLAGLPQPERAAPEPASIQQIWRWQPTDFSFKSDSRPANPFLVDFAADIHGPNGIALRLPGFYDGDHTWKVRFSAAALGEWRLTTHSSVHDLDARQITCLCVRNPDPSIHGSPRVDPEHPHHFVYEDGARRQPMGYECDWLWALDMQGPTLKAMGPFLDRIAAAGFNFIILDTYAYDTTWRPGLTGPDDYGPPPAYAWEGSNDRPDQSRFNLAYWRHFDRVIAALNQRGIVAHVLLKVYNKGVHWPVPGSTEDDLYFRWVIARYAAYPNVTWDLSKEANNEKSLSYKLDRLNFIRANDPYRRLLTAHDDRATYDQGAYDGILDYRTDQQHSTWHKSMRAHLAQHPWPVVNAEFGYECGPGGLDDRTYPVVQSPEELARRAWEIRMAGGYVAYYYTYTAWDIIRPSDTPPGYAYFRHLHDFFAGTRDWLLQPLDELVSDGYCLADPGREYVVFENKAVPFTLRLSGLAAPLPARWFQPYSGQWHDAGLLTNGVVSLRPPAEWGDGPVALHVGQVAKAKTNHPGPLAAPMPG